MKRIIKFLQTWEIAQRWEIILLIALIGILVMVTSCHAGIVGYAFMENKPDYAMPTPFNFHSSQEAIDFANRVKWIEPMRLDLIRFIDHLQDEASFSYSYLSDTENARIQKIYKDWIIYCTAALLTINRYKRMGIPGDPAQAVGSSFYAGSEPVERK